MNMTQEDKNGTEMEEYLKPLHKGWKIFIIIIVIIFLSIIIKNCTIEVKNLIAEPFVNVQSITIGNTTIFEGTLVVDCLQEKNWSVMFTYDSYEIDMPLNDLCNLVDEVTE